MQMILAALVLTLCVTLVDAKVAARGADRASQHSEHLGQ